MSKKFTKNFFGSEIKNKEYHLIVIGDEKIFLGPKLFIFIKFFFSLSVSHQCKLFSLKNSQKLLFFG